MIENKISLLFIFFISFLSSNLFTQPDCIPINQYKNTPAVATYIDSISLSQYETGIFTINPEGFENLGGLPQLESTFKYGNTFSYHLNKISFSRRDSSIWYYHYQQRYNNIPLLDKGFKLTVIKNDYTPLPGYPNIYRAPTTGPGPDGPVSCDGLVSVNPNLVDPTGIPSTTTNDLSWPAAEQLLINELGVNSSDIISHQIVYVNGMQDSCKMELVYEVNFNQGGRRKAYIGFDSEEIFVKPISFSTINAPTINYGTQFLDDSPAPNGTNTWLVSGDGRLRSEEKNGVDLRSNFFLTNIEDQIDDNDIPVTTSTFAWSNEGSPRTFECHFTANEALQAYDEIGITFNSVTVFTSNVFGDSPYASGISNLENAFISFMPISDNENNTINLSTHDVVGHELAHCFLYEFIEAGGSLDAKTLHEGIADIYGIFTESRARGGFNWVMGDETPNGADAIDRDAENPNHDCFTNVENLQAQHQRSLIISHWYFLLMEGLVSAEITAGDDIEIIEMVTESVNMLNNDSSIESFRDATLVYAETEFGVCSQIFTNIARAWNEVCVGYTDVCPFNIRGPINVCSDVNSPVSYWVEGGLPGATYRWIFPIGWTVPGSQGNSYQGATLTVTDFSASPPYPKQYILQVKSLTTGAQFNQQRITRLVNCNGGGSGCNDLGGFRNTSNVNVIEMGDSLYEENEMYPYVSNPESRNIRAYSLIGQLMYEGSGSLQEKNLPTGVYIVVELTETGQHVTSKKVFVK